MTTPFRVVDRICQVEAPLNWSPDKDWLMLEALQTMVHYHYEACPDLRAYYKHRGFHPNQLHSLADLARLPPLNVQAMKYFLLKSRPENCAILKLTSSGTRGQKTQIWFDAESLQRAQSMLDGLWRQQGLVSEQRTNYLMFIYDPKDAEDLGIAFSIQNQQRFAPIQESFFAIRKDCTGAWKFDRDGVLQKLADFQKQGLPVRLLGIPAFIHDTLEYLIDKDIRFQMPADSYVLTGGGWKAAEDRKITKEQFHQEIAERLGISSDRVLDGYGMAEHSAPYMECREHRFHVPAYCRVQIRNPENMRLLPAGLPGLIELITPFNTMMPNLSVLSTDLGRLTEQRCTCGFSSPTFELLGRAGTQKHKGCAIHASEIVRRAET